MSAFSSGPGAGDPVNLATGEEEYTPGPDLVVYNPIGPSVVWSRLYNSLRGHDVTHEFDDFGMGWSHSYNVGIYDPGVYKDPQIRQGVSSAVPNEASHAPAGSLSWDIRDNNGTTVATSASPGSWTVSYNYSTGIFTLGVPSTATVADHYEVRYKIPPPVQQGWASAHFDVIPASATNPQVPRQLHHYPQRHRNRDLRWWRHLGHPQQFGNDHCHLLGSQRLAVYGYNQSQLQVPAHSALFGDYRLQL